MKEIKEMLLSVSSEKGIFFLRSFLAAEIVSLFIFFLVAIFKYSSTVLIMGLMAISGLFLVFITVVCLTIVIKITSFKNKKHRMILIHHPNGTSSVYCEPIWGKIPYTKIYFPSNWPDSIERSEKKDFHFFWEILIEMDDLDNGVVKTSALIPITWSFTWQSLTIEDLKKIAKAGGDNYVHSIDIENYLENLFLSLNDGEEIKTKTSEAALLWHSKKITPVHFRRILEHEIVFPEKIFSGTTVEKMTLALAEEKTSVILVDPINSNNGSNS